MSDALAERSRGRTQYGKFCACHVRGYMPEKSLRATKFLCIVCDREVDPQREAWTTREYWHGKAMG